MRHFAPPFHFAFRGNPPLIDTRILINRLIAEIPNAVQFPGPVLGRIAVDGFLAAKYNVYRISLINLLNGTVRIYAVAKSSDPANILSLNKIALSAPKDIAFFKASLA